MKKITIDIDWRSCKADGISSEEFKLKIESEFNNNLTLKFLFSHQVGSPYYKDGCSSIKFQNIEESNEKSIEATIKNIYSNLKQGN